VNGGASGDTGIWGGPAQAAVRRRSDDASRRLRLERILSMMTHG